MYYLIFPMLILLLTCIVVGGIYFALFRWLPKKLYNSLTGLVALAAIYIWAVPLKLGFYEFFRSTF